MVCSAFFAVLSPLQATSLRLTCRSYHTNAILKSKRLTTASAIHMAAEQGYVNLLEHLLLFPAELDFPPALPASLWFSAFKSGSSSMLHFLLNIRCPSVRYLRIPEDLAKRISTVQNGSSPLSWAVELMNFFHLNLDEVGGIQIFVSLFLQIIEIQPSHVIPLIWAPFQTAAGPVQVISSLLANPQLSLAQVLALSELFRFNIPREIPQSPIHHESAAMMWLGATRSGDLEKVDYVAGRFPTTRAPLIGGSQASVLNCESEQIIQKYFISNPQFLTFLNGFLLFNSKIDFFQLLPPNVAANRVLSELQARDPIKMLLHWFGGPANSVNRFQRFFDGIPQLLMQPALLEAAYSAALILGERSAVAHLEVATQIDQRSNPEFISSLFVIAIRRARLDEVQRLWSNYSKAQRDSAKLGPALHQALLTLLPKPRARGRLISFLSSEDERIIIFCVAKLRALCPSEFPVYLASIIRALMDSKRVCSRTVPLLKALYCSGPPQDAEKVLTEIMGRSGHSPESIELHFGAIKANLQSGNPVYQ